MSENKYIFLNGLIDLAQSRLGSKIVYKTDEFFAPAKRIINSWTPVFKEGVFDKHGKWMDGWETRRKRTKGHDYLIIKLVTAVETLVSCKPHIVIIKSVRNN